MRCGEKSEMRIILGCDKKNKLYRLIDIYTKFDDIVDSVKDLNTKVERVKQLKDARDDSE